MRFAPAFLLLFLFAACDGKVPLQAHPGTFDFTAAHWFASEKTEYVFFSISGLRPGQADLNWPARFELATHGARVQGLSVDADGFAGLNLATAVHRHRLVRCGPDRVCGSYSFHAERPVSQLTLRYRYDAGAPMAETTEIPVSTHPDGDSADSQSAQVYGVFNADNSAVQVKVHDNFGSPDADQVAQYGMERSFEVESAQLVDLNADQEQATFDKTGSVFLFPALACAESLKTDASKANAVPKNTTRFSGHELWMRTVFPSDDTRSAVCFRARALDGQAQTLTELPAVARRNPVLVAQPLQITPPVGDAVKIPIVLSYCQDEPRGPELVSTLFLNYQRFILQIPNGGIDACFAVHQETRFALDLERVMNEKLAAARTAEANGAFGPKVQDFFFTVVINERLSSDIRVSHQVIAQKLATLIASEVKLVSPRLVGAFVYDSQSAESRDLPMNDKVIWCPRKEQKAADPSQPSSEVTANCTPRDAAGKMSFGPLNFRIPLGPFPTLDRYEQYVRDNDDLGLNKNPRLVIRTVQTNASSQTQAPAQKGATLYTFFDNERISLATGERLKFCRDRDDDGLLQDVEFKVTGPDGKTSLLGTDAAQALAAGGAEAPTLHVGLSWASPFIGEFAFDNPVEGSILGLIPLSKTFRSEQRLGDPQWTRATWDLQPLLQKCERFCFHPYFDESGVYQIQQSWNQVPRCPAPKIGEPGA